MYLSACAVPAHLWWHPAQKSCCELLLELRDSFLWLSPIRTPTLPLFWALSLSLSPWFLCTLPAHHILSIQASLLGLMVLLQLSCIRANYCCPQQAQLTSLSQSALLQLHTPVYFFFCLFVFLDMKTVVKKNMSGKKTHTFSPALAYTRTSSNSSVPR